MFASLEIHLLHFFVVPPVIPVTIILRQTSTLLFLSTFLHNRKEDGWEGRRPCLGISFQDIFSETGVFQKRHALFPLFRAWLICKVTFMQRNFIRRANLLRRIDCKLVEFYYKKKETNKRRKHRIRGRKEEKMGVARGAITNVTRLCFM